MCFYSRVLSTGLNPLWREQDLMNNLGLPIIGLGARSAEYDHLPLQWMPHIQVADVAASVQRALDLGGRVLMHAKGADGKSQWAVLLDLTVSGASATYGFYREVVGWSVQNVEMEDGSERCADYNMLGGMETRRRESAMREA